MPTTTNGIYSVTLKGEVFGQEVINVFNYREVAGTEGEFNSLESLWQTTIFDDLQAVLAQSYFFISLDISNPTGDRPTQSFPYPVSTQGDLSGETLPPFTVASLKYNRFFTDTRNGFKRIGPATEAQQNGGIWSTGYLLLLQTLAGQLSLVLSDASNTFVPIILRAQPDPFGIYTFNNITGITVSDNVTTQNSRKATS